jgi:hypothetical protein
VNAELDARRRAAAAVLADYRRELESAPLSRPPGREWMLRLADVLGDLLDTLDQAGRSGDAAVAGPDVTAGAGPFQTEREAAASIRHQLAAATLGPPRTLTDRNHRMLGQAAAMAGVELGAYDQQIVGWLAAYEPSTCAVVAGLVSRAHAAGRSRQVLPAGELATIAEALGEAAGLIRQQAATCSDCAASPAEVCGDHELALDRAEEYERLAGLLGGQR